MGIPRFACLTNSKSPSMNPNHHWKLFFINQPLFLCYLSVLLFHRSIKHFSMYLKRKISLSFTLEVKILRKRQSSSPWKKGGSYIGWKQYGGAMLMIRVIMVIMAIMVIMVITTMEIMIPSIPGPLPTRHRRWLGSSPA